MTISTRDNRQAAKIDVLLSEEGDEDTLLVRAFWTKGGVAVFGTSPSDAIKQMKAAQDIYNLDEGYRILADTDNKRVARLYRPDGAVSMPLTPYALKHALKSGNIEWPEQGADAAAPADEVERSSNGVALDGAVAYREGTPSVDCPYTTETEDDEEYAKFIAWNEDWDAAADAATTEEETKGGSVVSERYRAKYAEAGHPTHCGDWLAEKLNELCLTGKGIDLPRFEAICSINGVDTTKYRREGTGWQGRLRMTGRNLLAKKVYLAGGVLLAPNADTEAGGNVEYRAPAEWMTAQRFKMPKSQQDKPIPEAKS